MDVRRYFNTPLFWWMLIAIPIFLHIFFLWRYSINAPRLDDFSDGFGFLTHFYSAETWREKLDWFFSRYQNHRWGFLHATYASYQTIDFRTANFLSMPWLLLLLGLWHCRTRNTPYHLPLLAAASFLIFNLHSWMGMFWITASLAAFPSIPLALLTFIFIANNKPLSTVFAISTAMLATFTNGNGVFIWLLAIGYLCALQVRSPQKSRAFSIAIWIVVALPVLYIFFSDTVFHPVNTQEDRVAGFLQKFLADPLLFFEGSFAAIGSNLIYYPGSDSDWRTITAIFFGATESLAMLYLLLRCAFRNNSPLLLLTLYIGATMAAIAASRVLFIGLHQAFQGHYKLYNSIFLLLLFAAWLDVRAQKNKETLSLSRWLAGISGTAYLASCILFLPTIDAYHQALVTDTKNWLYTNKLMRGESQLYVKQPNLKLATAVKEGFYNPWTLLSAQEIPTDIIYSTACPQPAAALTAKLQSQARALAVHIDVAPSATMTKMCLQGAQQAIFFTMPKQEKISGTEANVSLWVPRNPEVEEDAGPWMLYALP